MRHFLLACLLLPLVAMAAPRGGIFIPRNSGYEGYMGQSHALFTRDGGVLHLVHGEWSGLQTSARMSVAFSVQPAGDANPAEVRQEFDRAPEFNFLEEGNQRIGLRVKFKLYDRAQRYYGHGMTETWLYPNGEAFITAAATIEGHQAATIRDAWIELNTKDGLVSHAVTNDTAIPMNGKDVPDRCLVFARPDAPGVALYWRSGRMEHNTFIYRKAGSAPTYFHWPDYFKQAYGTGAYLKDAAIVPGGARLRWPLDGKTRSFNALFRLATATEAQARAYVAAEREPVKLAVTGGVVHGNLDGYNDLEGAYEVRKAADPMVVTLPADPLGRTVRLKVVGLAKAGGAVTAALDDTALVPQLCADGGIADDPLAPIREQPERAADMAVVTVKLTGAPQTLTIREGEGVQYVYQSRDAWRNVACFTSKGGGRYAGFRFSLVDGHARNMRAYGRADWALSENLLTWFSYCGYTPEQVLDQLRDFEIIKNGPDEAIFRYVSANAADGAQSEYLVRVPADSPAMRMDVTATFTVLRDWPYPSVQFFDVFPFRGVWTEDWWYDETLWLTPDGRWKTRKTISGLFEGDTTLGTFAGGGFFGLYSADRGNMLMLTKNFTPNLPVAHVICGNYIDYHMTVQFAPGPNGKPTPPPPGYQVRMQYELAVWGDQNATREQLLNIGAKSLHAGTLMIPAQ